MDILTTTLQEMLADFLAFLPDLIIALLIFVVSLYAAGFLAKLVRGGMQRRKADPEIALLMTQLTRWSAVILGIIMALQQVGFNVSGFLAGVGILGFTVGFALQDVSKNFVAGMLLLLEQPFDIGDTIEVGDFIGTVGNVELRATELYTFDGQNVLIPNAEVFTSAIKNYSRYSKRRLELKAGVSYDSDLEHVRQTALEAIQPIPGLLADPAPTVVFDNLGSSTVDFSLYYWVDLDVGDYFGSLDQAITEIKAAFETQGIEMPYPTQTVILNQ